MEKLHNKDLLIDRGFIGGKWVEAHHGETFPVFNPADHQVIGNVSNMGQVEIEQAIGHADEAFELWSGYTAKERQSLLHQWYELILENKQDLATMMVLEQGKPLKEALMEVNYAASFIHWFAGQATRIRGSIMSDYSPNAQLQYTKEPVGVVGIITPWNFPLAMITRKVAPALAAGCTVIIKPSEFTPYGALALAKLAQKAGIPDGVCQVVPTINAKEFGEIICRSTTVKKISFTGSTRVGKLLLKQSADTVKKMSMELGGNAPFIVFDDADLDLAVEALITTKFRNTGQTCVCANRIFVDQQIQDRFVEMLKEKVEKFIVADGFTQGVTQGPLINQAALTKVKRHVEQSLANGAKLVLGGKSHARGGTFFEPTILTGVSADEIFSCEETFGPVAPIISFKDENEVIKQANDTPYGLSAYFCTKDYKRIYRVHRKLQAGMVGVNTGLLSNEFGPFGGIKESGLGREGSTLGIEEYLENKYSVINY